MGWQKGGFDYTERDCGSQKSITGLICKELQKFYFLFFRELLHLLLDVNPITPAA